MNNEVNLRGTLRTSKLNINSQKININDIMPVYNEMMPRHFYRIALVTGVLPSRESEEREALVRVVKTNTILEHPINSSVLKIHIMTLTKQLRQENSSKGKKQP